MNVLITGGAGFIGSNFVHYLLEHHPDYRMTVLDKLTYAGNLNNLKDVMERIEFVKGDICDKKMVRKVVKTCNYVINFAAETHVDRSIVDGGIFVRTDVLGTYNLLEAARLYDTEKYVQISTDEVYGSTETGSFKESDPLSPSSPYSASKASADLLVLSYFVTHDLPVMITRSSNNFGPHQHPEKLVPRFITNALRGKELPIYGNGLNVRDWIYVADNCSAIDTVMHEGKKGEIYNIGGGNEKTNLEITEIVLQTLAKPRELMRFVEDRKGHDRRYSIDCSKIKSLGWSPLHPFGEAMIETIEWYKNNEWWWNPLVEHQ